MNWADFTHSGPYVSWSQPAHLRYFVLPRSCPKSGRRRPAEAVRPRRTPPHSLGPRCSADARWPPGHSPAAPTVHAMFSFFPNPTPATTQRRARGNATSPEVPLGQLRRQGAQASGLTRGRDRELLRRDRVQVVLLLSASLPPLALD
jgi:hypothetical protein